MKKKKKKKKLSSYDQRRMDGVKGKEKKNVTPEVAYKVCLPSSSSCCSFFLPLISVHGK